MAGPEGADTLQGIERLRFPDGTLALENGDTAVQAFRLYRLALDREPDAAGLGSHVDRLDGGAPLTDVALDFLGSAEFLQKYGTLSDADFVDQLYDNLRGTQGDPDGFAFHLGRLEAGVGRESVLVDFSESAESQLGTAPLVADGVWFT
ncbi:DUF4214 domain-containing protein [Skermanella rosea]|nr:DUF4214 domain-containing protein [Skermanella rosea]